MEILRDFGVQPTLLIAQIVNFAILLFVLQRFLYKPIMRVLEERRKKIETSVKQAEEMEKKFEETSTRQEEMLAKAQSQAEKIISEAKEEAKSLSQQLQQETSDQAAETIKRTQENLELQKQEMVTRAKQELATLVFAVTEKVIAKEVKGPEKEKIIRSAIEEIKK